jgi:hypothetical protein
MRTARIVHHHTQRSAEHPYPHLACAAATRVLDRRGYHLHLHRPGARSPGFDQLAAAAFRLLSGSRLPSNV